MSLDVASAIRATRERLAELDEERDRLVKDLEHWRQLLGVKDARRGGGKPRKRRPIREQSTVWWAQKVLKHLGHDEEIGNLVRAIEEFSGLNVRKSTLVSNLSRYVRAGDTFRRQSPGVYGLIEFGAQEEQQQGTG